MYKPYGVAKELFVFEECMMGVILNSIVMQSFIDKLVFQGKIPGIKYIKSIIFYAAFLMPLVVVFVPSLFSEFGEWGWRVLLALLFLRPIADLFPKFRVLKSLLFLRRELGVLSAVLILSHAAGFFLNYEQSFFEKVFDVRFWRMDNFLMWGMLGVFVAFVLLITSNNFSMKFLGKWWKRIQRFAYLFVFFGAIHLVLLEPDEIWEVLLPVFVLGAVCGLAYLKGRRPQLSAN